MDALRRSFAELEEYQRELGVRIVVENMPGVGYSHFGGPGDLDLGELGLILDTGHAAICGTLHDFLREPRAKLAHVHLHDNRGPVDTGDPHLPLGRGVVDAGAVIRVARASDATIILELLDEARRRRAPRPGCAGSGSRRRRRRVGLAPAARMPAAAVCASGTSRRRTSPRYGT